MGKESYQEKYVELTETKLSRDEVSTENCFGDFACKDCLEQTCTDTAQAHCPTYKTLRSAAEENALPQFPIASGKCNFSYLTCEAHYCQRLDLNPETKLTTSMWTASAKPTYPCVFGASGTGAGALLSTISPEDSIPPKYSGVTTERIVPCCFGSVVQFLKDTTCSAGEQENPFDSENRVFWQSPHGREDQQADSAVLFTLKELACVSWKALIALMDRMELQKVNIELDEQSNSGESLEDNYTEVVDSEKAAMRSPFDNDDAESQKFLTNGYLGKKKLEEYKEEYHRGRASFGMSSFNLSNAIMGSGILGLSYAMANTGIILFVILLLSVAILSLYSVHLLLKTAKEGGSLIYEKLGEKAFGWPGKCGVFISVTMQNIGAMSSYLFIIKYELPEVIRAFMKLEETSGEWYLNGNYLIILVTVGIILPLSLLKTLGYLGYTSGFSLTCMVFFVSAVIFKKSQIPCPLPMVNHGTENWTSTNSTVPMHLIMLPNESLSSGVNFMMDNTAGQLPVLEEPKDTFPKSGVEYEAHSDISDQCQPKYFVFNSRTAYAIPILAFAFVCHPEVLPIYSELKDRSRKRMQNVSNVSITGMLIMYLLAALFGYLTFYGEVEDELLHTYTRVYTFDSLLLSVRLAVLVAVTLTVPLVLFPIRSSISALLFPKRPFSWIRHFLIAAVILAFNNLLVIFVPTIKDIFGFIGASSATMLIFILPAAFYLRLVDKEPMKSPQKIGALVFLIVGIIFMIVSMTLIVMDWIYNSPSSRHH